MDQKLYGAVEAGGTKFVCAVGTGPADILAELRIPTLSPADTIPHVLEFFHAQEALHETLAGVGIASFGPLDLHSGSPAYGSITATPKPGWSRTNLFGKIRESLYTPVFIDTDVNGAAMGEFCWGAARGLDTFIYLTIGTGIGGGGMVNGKLMRGLLHPEMGHMRIPHDREEDPFDGICSFHADCLEGLASGPAIHARWGTRPEDLPEDHPAWALEARYISLAVANLVCTISPERVILGGGIMSQTHLLPRIRRNVVESLNGYVQAPAILNEIDDYLVLPGLGTRSGILGALALAMQASDAK